MLNLIIVEDSKACGFYPISVSHPVYDLFYGCFNVVDRLKHYFKPKSVSLCCRWYMAGLSRLRYNLPVNDFTSLDGDCLVINAAIKPDTEIFDKLKAAPVNTAYFGSNSFIGGRFDGELIQKIDLAKVIESPSAMPQGIDIQTLEAASYEHLWEIVNANSQAIEFDLSIIPDISHWRRSPQANKHGDNVYIHPKTEIGQGVFIDDSGGPVIIDKGVKIEPRSLIQGPVYIGQGSVVMAGMVREGCSLGPVCKVGGELEETIILGYSNKCHEGFIGHSYIGEWVNLGALTTNSDLKNNYGEISISMNWQLVKTGSIKVGCFIGDHTKTGIGTLLNTGIVIGFSNNLYGGGLFMEKEIGHFRWGTPGNLVGYRLEKAMEVAKAAMNRRNIVFDEAYQTLFERISEIEFHNDIN